MVGGDMHLCMFCCSAVEYLAQRRPDVDIPWVWCERMIGVLRWRISQVQDEGHTYYVQPMDDVVPVEMSPEINIELRRRVN
jgi:hypothetical protein